MSISEAKFDNLGREAVDYVAACAIDSWTQHPYYDVPNFHRIVVHGSTFPLEWLKLSIAPGVTNPTTPTSWGPFSWQRMPQP